MNRTTIITLSVVLAVLVGTIYTSSLLGLAGAGLAAYILRRFYVLETRRPETRTEKVGFVFVALAFAVLVLGSLFTTLPFFAVAGGMAVSGFLGCLMTDIFGMLFRS